MPHLTSDDLKRFVVQSQPEQFHAALPQFPVQELAESFGWLQTKGAHQSEVKLALLFEFIDSPETLETLGKNLTVQQFLQMLTFLDLHPPFQNRLSYILIGLQPQIFCLALKFFQSAHLALFKEESLLEPLQYHLTQFVHEGEQLYKEIDLLQQQFEESLLSVTAQGLTVESLEELISRIEPLRNQLLDFLERVNVALSIAWNTDRIDLIEKLSHINESLQHLLTISIGHPSSDNLKSTGLYSKMEQTFSKIFDSSLKDEDASVEGLTRLSIWHLKDYWELGLLPQIKQLQELDMDVHSPEHQRTSYHQHLFSQVQKQLELLNIGTVGHLKKESIFSKPLLKAYIDRNRHLLLI